ncbi:MAG: NUDIX domain-containing protein [Myxococcota bacterium]
MTPRRVSDIDWAQWRAVDPATLLFVIDQARDRTLLIRKKRGLGAGKINAPGGRIEPGETPFAAAVREVEEEVCVRPREVTPSGLLRFQFVDGYSLHVHVFRADAWEGEPRETDEAVPMWLSTAALPFDEMWADDRLWVPHVLSRRHFDGRFIFEGDTMLDHALSVED